ncbi:MAG: bifunctional diguanylate cyclase/phosphodiesterase [Clostridiales bacterium]|nr:bifunctional diguanylate cyclase/phosphodiesterase [Clostridiales bacterium]
METDFTTISIRQLELVMHSLSKSTDDYIFCWDLNEDVLEITDVIVDLFDLPSGNFDNALNVFNKIIFKDDLEIFNCQMVKIKVEKLDKINIEIRLISKDGNTTWISFRGQVIDADGYEDRYLFGRVSLIGNKRKADDLSGMHTEEQSKLDFIENIQNENNTGFILKLGIDNLKDINEKHGTAEGDNIIRQLAECIKQTIGNDEKAYKYDGDCFTIFNYASSNVSLASRLYRDIRRAIDSKIVAAGYNIFYTVSGCIVSFPENGMDFEKLIKSADFALNEAKRNGKNCWYIYDEIRFNEHIKTLDILQKLRNDITNGFAGFEVFYQPIVDCDTCKIKGAEALLRWSSNEYGFVSPAVFIPILEESGLIIPVGRFVIYTAIKQCKLWQKYLPGFTININLSFIQIRKSDIVNDVIDFIEDIDIEPNYITFEFTESGFIENDKQVNRLITAFRNKGITLALDDFGTGYSNLVYLQNMKVDTIKLDRSFVSKAIDNDYYFRLISNIVKMAHNINLKVCLEGIETDDEKNKLDSMSPDFIQGFLYGKPVNATKSSWDNFMSK